MVSLLSSQKCAFPWGFPQFVPFHPGLGRAGTVSGEEGGVHVADRLGRPVELGQLRHVLVAVLVLGTVLVIVLALVLGAWLPASWP